MSKARVPPVPPAGKSDKGPAKAGRSNVARHRKTAAGFSPRSRSSPQIVIAFVIEL
jgi:hypothetical protein